MVLSSTGPITFKVQHPMSSQIIRLWQIFVDAVNPLCKIVHEPTTYNAILAATADLSNVPRNLEALMFSIYAIAVYTLDNRECEALFGEKRSTVLARYQLGTRLALQRASLLKCTDKTTLQAFVIYLVGPPACCDPALTPCSSACAQPSIPASYGSTPAWPCA